MPSPSQYLEADNFTAQSKGSGGGGGRNKGKNKPKKGSPDGKYNSKHIRIALEKKKLGGK
jgi:hypothetical protein